MKDSKKSKLEPLSIILDASELILFDKSETRLTGTVEFRKQDGLIPKEIELRFVAGAVSKFEDSYQEIFLRGTDRFFDKKILLWNESSHLTCGLPKAEDLLNGIIHNCNLRLLFSIWTSNSRYKSSFCQEWHSHY